MRSGIYEGTVWHRRLRPVPHDFSVPLFMMYLDLEELPSLFDGRWLWSAKGPAPAWFRAADYLGRGNTGLAEAVRSEAETLTGHRPAGPIGVLTHLRYLGFIMNPVTFYYCFGENGEELEVILAEITNTPWKERHVYALRGAENEESPTGQPHRFGKAFHISPFMPMDQEYHWHFSDPAGRLDVHMENHDDTGKLFEASLSLRRSEITRTSLARVLLRFPLMTARVAAGIYWHALKLRLKGNPYFAHPHNSTP